MVINLFYKRNLQIIWQFLLCRKTRIIPGFELAAALTATGQHKTGNKLNMLREIKRNCAIKRMLTVFMLPTSKTLRGHIGFGLSVCVSVRASVTLCIRSRTILAMVGSWNLIHGMCMKNKRARIFFLFYRTCHCRIMPLFILFQLFHCKPMESCEQTV